MSHSLLEYLSVDAREEYIRGYRTPAPEPATPRRIGAQLGERVIFVREDVEGVQEAAAEEVAHGKKERKDKKEKRG